MNMNTIRNALLATTLSVGTAHADLPKYLTNAITQSVNEVLSQTNPTTADLPKYLTAAIDRSVKLVLSNPLPEIDTTTKTQERPRTYIDDLVEKPEWNENLEYKPVVIPTEPPNNYKVKLGPAKKLKRKSKSSK